MSFFVLLFSISSIFLIEKYVVDQSRKILVVCLMCGADNKWLKKGKLIRRECLYL